MLGSLATPDNWPEDALSMRFSAPPPPGSTMELCIGPNRELT